MREAAVYAGNVPLAAQRGWKLIHTLTGRWSDAAGEGGGDRVPEQRAGRGQAGHSGEGGRGVTARTLYAVRRAGPLNDIWPTCRSAALCLLRCVGAMCRNPMLQALEVELQAARRSASAHDSEQVPPTTYRIRSGTRFLMHGRTASLHMAHAYEHPLPHVLPSKASGSTNLTLWCLA